MCWLSLTESLTGNRHPAVCAWGCLFCALSRTHPSSSGHLQGVLRLLCLGKGGLPALLTAQLCIYSLFAIKNLFIFRVATCQRLPAQDNPITPLMVSPEWANNRRDCHGGGTWELLECCFCCLFIFLGEPDHRPLEAAKLILVLCRFFLFPKQWQFEGGYSQIFVMD